MRKINIVGILTMVGFVISCGQPKEKTAATNSHQNRMNTYLEASASNGFNGAVLIAKGDSILINKGYGWADKTDSVPNTPETIFDICSVTKQFTGAAILKLEEAGKLNVTDTLGMYFPEIPRDKAKITIHQLLTHSAGFDHGFGVGDFHHIGREEYFKQLFDTELLFTPGEKYAYSNSGYSVLGRIIELVSGQTYEAYLNENLFAPSGMKLTGYLLPNWDTHAVATEYLYNVIDKGSHASKYLADGKIAWALKANGGINSNQEDMYKWYLALSNHKVLSPASIEKLTTPYVAEYEDESSHYAYGWAIFQSPRGTKVISHNGFNGISYYEFSWFPEEKAVILFATNTSTREISRIPYELEKMLFDTTYVPTPISKNNVSEMLAFTKEYTEDISQLGAVIQEKYKSVITSPAVLNRLVGIYTREDEMAKAIALGELNLELFPDDGNLWDTMGNVYIANQQREKGIACYQKALELAPQSGDCFWCENSKKQLKKAMDE